MAARRLVRLTSIAVLVIAALNAKTYPVDAIVIATDPVARTILVSHRPIPGFMDAMAMPFRVADPDELRDLAPGNRITFDLVVTKDHSLARAIRKTSEGEEILAPKERRRLGDPLPVFSLIDQSGALFSSSALAGKVSAINFVYTRCPLPDVCPRLSANFATVARRLRAYLGRDLMLITITIDPDYDTPAVLSAYARRFGADPAGWRFLTGDIAQVSAALGEVYWTGEGTIGHNSATAIFDRTGHLAATLAGATWRADQLEKLILYQLENKK